MKVVMLSGGFDSAALIFDYKFDEAVFIDYNQPNLQQEFEHSQNLALSRQLPCVHITIPTPSVTNERTNLFFARNTLMVLAVVNFYLQHGKEVKEIWFGFSADDQADYVDCTPEWVDLLHQLLKMHGISARVHTPFVVTPKKELIKRHPELLLRTWSCYKGGQVPCGDCAACKLREASIQPTRLRMHEIFYSIQGEGPAAGQPHVFVRFQGCNVGCSWCDTKHTWDGSGGVAMSVDEIVEEVKLYPYAKGICLTGGEPLQQDPDLLNALVGKLALLAPIWVETSGAGEMIKGWHYHNIVLSPKWHQPLPTIQGTYLKVIISQPSDAGYAIELVKRHQPKATYLQPVWGNKEMTKLAAKLCKQHGWNLSIQTHKYIGVP